MWRQRLRWLKGGHLFLLGPDSVFFKKQPHMSFYQKSIYWLCPIAHFVQFWAEPVLFTLPCASWLSQSAAWHLHVICWLACCSRLCPCAGLTKAGWVVCCAHGHAGK